ncbi:MAG TPA: hypothetical protein VOA80_22445 [Thermoanaerobaculia bacterium]|nr:hypothetical protein [Thermoanaerobaculia bacterium]
MLALEALRAKHGDAFILHFGSAEEPRLAVIDGGPPGVYVDALQPRLQQIREERRLAATAPLEIEWMMVSHIDADHIAGLLQMVRAIRDMQEAKKAVPWKICRCWHNSFDDLLGNQDASLASGASVMSPASIGDLLRQEGSLVLASVGQGRELRRLLAALDLANNPPFKGLVTAGHSPIRVGDLELMVVAPSKAHLAALQEDWDEKIQPMLKKEKDQAGRAAIASYVDTSVYNLSSMVVLVEADAKRILLTGDGRGDHTLAGLDASGLLDRDGKIEVDILKVPHHGSDRDVKLDYFQRIVAKHYVISADGRYDNPDVDTLQMISAARPDDAFTIHFTYPLDEFHVPKVGSDIAAFFAGEKAAGRKYGIETRAAADLSLTIALA